MDQRGLAPRSVTVRQMADLLLAKRSDVDSDKKLTVGKCWTQNFVQRQPALRSRYNRKYDYQRAKCEDPMIIRDYSRLVSTRTEYNCKVWDSRRGYIQL
jgi:hypothetical protein